MQYAGELAVSLEHNPLNDMMNEGAAHATKCRMNVLLHVELDPHAIQIE